VAASLDRAVITRIVDFQTFLRFTEDMSEQAICPAGYDEQAMGRFALDLPMHASASASDKPIGTRVITDTGDRILFRTAANTASARVN
jgi:hypothetical protein